MKTQRLLVIVLGLQVLMLAGQWLGQPQMLSTASAQVPDAGAQRNQVIDELKSIDGRLEQIARLLDSGQLMVRTQASATAPEEKRPQPK